MPMCISQLKFCSQFIPCCLPSCKAFYSSNYCQVFLYSPLYPNYYEVSQSTPYISTPHQTLILLLSFDFLLVLQ